jgi:Xaa-Pro aminopeptidase
MSLSQKERDRRHSELRKRMKGMGIDIVLVFGDTGDWGLRYGNLRYLTNSKVIFGNSAMVFPLDQEPVMFMFSGLQANWAKQLSWINDARFSSNLIFDIVSTLKSLRLKDGRLGVISLASLPFSWYKTLCQEFPSINLIEMGPIIEEMRYIKGEEEIGLVEKSAQIADKGFNNIIQGLKPGMTEFEALALLEHPMREEGGDDFFDLIFSGPFGTGVKMIPFAITGRKEPSRTIQAGDSVLFEITPRYGGYWAQLVRVINVGKQNQLLIDYNRVARDGIEAAIQYFKPGIKLGDALKEAKKVIESAGFELRLPMGHLCGLNLVESRISVESDEILQPGMVIIFHPIVAGSGDTQMFVGEIYVITSEGYKRLHQAQDELLVV